MRTYRFTISFFKGYIASPYWPELGRVIDIEKESGMNRCRSDATIRAALEQHLKKIGVSPAEYEELKRLAKRPFYVSSPPPAPAAAPSPTPSPTPTIIIPQHHVYGCLVHAADTVRSAGRPCSPEQMRSLVDASDLLTNRTEPDGVWERMVQPKKDGKALSNQRSLRSDPYIANFEATGTLTFSEKFIKADVLKELLVYAGENIGIGASRKMGWGRFSLIKWEEQ